MPETEIMEVTISDEEADVTVEPVGSNIFRVRLEGLVRGADIFEANVQVFSMLAATIDLPINFYSVNTDFIEPGSE